MIDWALYWNVPEPPLVLGIPRGEFIDILVYDQKIPEPKHIKAIQSISQQISADLSWSEHISAALQHYVAHCCSTLPIFAHGLSQTIQWKSMCLTHPDNSWHILARSCKDTLVILGFWQAKGGLHWHTMTYSSLLDITRLWPEHTRTIQNHPEPISKQFKAYLSRSQKISAILSRFQISADLSSTILIYFAHLCTTLSYFAHLCPQTIQWKKTWVVVNNREQFWYVAIICDYW